MGGRGKPRRPGATLSDQRPAWTAGVSPRERGAVSTPALVLRWGGPARAERSLQNSAPLARLQTGNRQAEGSQGA